MFRDIFIGDGGTELHGRKLLYSPLNNSWESSLNKIAPKLDLESQDILINFYQKLKIILVFKDSCRTQN